MYWTRDGGTADPASASIIPVKVPTCRVSFLFLRLYAPTSRFGIPEPVPLHVITTKIDY